MYLYVTKDTAYDKTVTEGRGRNKKTTTIRVGPTSYHDVTKRARSLAEQEIKILNRHCEKTGGNRFLFPVDSDDNNETFASHGKLSGLLQDHFFVDSFPCDDILEDGIAKSARIVMNKFKEILDEIKHTSIKQKGVLKRLSLDFVKVVFVPL